MKIKMESETEKGFYHTLRRFNRIYITYFAPNFSLFGLDIKEELLINYTLTKERSAKIKYAHSSEDLPKEQKDILKKAIMNNIPVNIVIDIRTPWEMTDGKRLTTKPKDFIVKVEKV